MNSKIKNIIVLCCTIGVCCLIPVFYMRGGVIDINLPAIDAKMLAEKVEKTQKAVQRTAVQRRNRKMVSCQVDDDCIIVDKDPCGCLVGPKGVTAINVEYTLEFNKMQEGLLAKACPTGKPSRQKECSPNAQAVCRANVCRIKY